MFLQFIFLCFICYVNAFTRFGSSIKDRITIKSPFVSHIFTTSPSILRAKVTDKIALLEEERKEEADDDDDEMVMIPLDDEDWWANGLQFGCTGCGKCCQNDGEVWLDGDEFVDLVEHLHLPAEDVLTIYSEEVKSGWVKLKNKVVTPSTEHSSKVLVEGEADRCIFLDNDGKKCTIYEARPIQCRTYPYWPRLLSREEEWKAEAVLPESSKEGKKWSAESGGCEGILHVDAPIVSAKTIHRNHELYKMYNDLFPFMSTGNDEQRLLTKSSVIQSIVKSTKEWVNSFVIKYNLCPFAENVFSSNKIRYRVFFGNEREKIKQRLKYEVLALLTSKEEDVATTLLMIPFGFQDFEEFYEFSLELEEYILPKIEEESQGPLPNDIGSSSELNEDGEKEMEMQNKKKCPILNTNDKIVKKKQSLLEKIREKKSQSQRGRESSENINSCDETSTNNDSNKNDIQLAFFHPGFCWADTDGDEAINYEKRAPFPTINLLRAASVREYANENKTKKIAQQNSESLENAGKNVLARLFETFLQLAL